MTTRRIGRWMLLVGLCLAGTGAIVWHREHSTVRVATFFYPPPGQDSAPIGTMLHSVGGSPFAPPDHTIAVLVFIAAGFVVLIGSILEYRHAK